MPEQTIDQIEENEISDEAVEAAGTRTEGTWTLSAPAAFSAIRCFNENVI
jgi:hypothetical protein